MATFFVLVVMISLAISMSFLASNAQKNATNSVKSTQSYYAAESGIEDALLRLKKNPALPTPLTYNLVVNNVTSTVVIPSTIGISKSITSKAINGTITRNIQTVCSVGNDTNANFYYGVEVGAGGLVMGNNSEVVGNVFSDGNISGSGTIDNNAVVSGNGHSISGVHVNGDAFAYSCLSGASVRNLTYVTGGSHTCTVRGTTTVQSQEISQQPLPIPQSQIDSWKSDAAAAQVITGDYTLTNNKSASLGPVKITGNLTISNNSTLNMTGTVYVVGNISLSNNATIKLDSSYGTSGGVLMADGTIPVSNNTTFSGSGQAKSYLLVISNNTSDSAISISNNTAGAVFYTTAGGLEISNGVSLVEATGYKVTMDNNSTIQYSSGIVNIYFASGPAGKWEVTSWQEL